MIPRTIHAALVGVVAIAVLLVGQAARAEKQPSAEALRWATLRILENTSASRAQVHQRILQSFERADVDGNGVSRSDYELVWRKRVSEQRAHRLAAILRNDLDGDGRVTREEVARAHIQEARRPLFTGGVRIDPSPGQIAEILDRLVTRDMHADTNNDATITWEEMQAHADTLVRPSMASYHEHQAIPLTLDADGDGVVREGEVKALIYQVFDAADTDRDDRLSTEERQALRAKESDLRRQEYAVEGRRRAWLSAEVRAKECDLPALPSGQVVFLKVHEGEGLSSVSLGGDDLAVSVSRVAIEPGAEALVLVLASQRPNIWLITGDVGRVSSVLVGGSTGDAGKLPRAGVVGVPAAKVAFARSTACLRHARSDAPRQSQREAARLATELGRRPDFIFAERRVATIRVPSGAVDRNSPLPQTTDLRRDGPAGDLWAYVLKHHPKGLIEIDAAQVIAAVDVRRFEVLPRQAGLAQLVESGALEIMPDTIRAKRKSDGSAPGGATLRDAAPHTVPRRYAVRRQITIPAGLDGAHAVTLVVPDGVAMPRGDPGQSQVVRKPQKLTFNRK